MTAQNINQGGWQNQRFLNVTSHDVILFCESQDITSEDRRKMMSKDTGQNNQDNQT